MGTGEWGMVGKRVKGLGIGMVGRRGKGIGDRDEGGGGEMVGRRRMGDEGKNGGWKEDGVGMVWERREKRGCDLNSETVAMLYINGKLQLKEGNQLVFMIVKAL